MESRLISGDSYSYVGYHSQAPPPTASRPLGVTFPGLVVNEAGQPNWVGHLITTYAHGQSNILVYDYAVRGDTAPGVARQIREQFLPTVGRKPNWARWSADDSLFVVSLTPISTVVPPKTKDTDLIATLPRPGSVFRIVGSCEFLVTSLFLSNDLVVLRCWMVVKQREINMSISASV